MANLRRNSLVAFALGLALTAVGPASAQEVGRKKLETLVKVGEAFARQDCGTVLRLGRPLIDGRGGADLPGEVAASLYDLVTLCEMRTEAKAEAYAHALRGTALEAASDDLWRFRLAMEGEAKRYEAAVATIEAMSRGREAALNAIPIDWMWSIDRALKADGSKELRKRLLKLLSSDGYTPSELLGSNDAFRHSYAEALADDGDTAGARAMVGQLRTSPTLIATSVDPRLRAFLPDNLDLRAAIEADLATHREQIRRDPKLLQPIIMAAEKLRKLGRPQEALELLMSVAGRIDDPDAFTDRDDMLNWWWDQRARTHIVLGQYDEAVTAFKDGAAVGESGSPNVSQLLNLAAAHNRFGHGDEALRTLSAFDDPKLVKSPYGDMVLRWARGCALAIVGRPAEAAADLAYATAHEKDGPEGSSELYLCLGQTDQAAASFIRRLDNPNERSAALLDLSEYDDPPVALPPDPIVVRMKALKARPDVIAAIQRAGGVRRFRFQRDVF